MSIDALPSAATTELGSELSVYQAYFGLDPRSGDLYDWQEQWAARDIDEMLRRDGYARQVEYVLTWPLLSVLPPVLKAGNGDKGELEFTIDALDRLQGAPWDLVCAQGVQSLIYRAVFHEPVWSAEGSNIYERICWRPPDTCSMTRHPKTGALTGFNQQVRGQALPAEMRFDKAKAIVWLHGAQRDPIRGSSEMQVAYRCYVDKQKIRVLWMMFLEGAAVPRVIAEAPAGQEEALAAQLVKLKNSGVAAVPVGTNAQTLDVSGKGADQFKAAIDFLNMEMAASVLAAFLNLTSSPGTVGRGSYALSKSATDFFTQSMDGNAKELAATVKSQVVAPLVRFNFPDAVVPEVRVGPISGVDAETIVTFLQNIAGGQGPSDLPREFLDELVIRAAGAFDLDVDKITAAIKAATDQAASSAPGAGPSAPVHATATVLTDVSRRVAAGQDPLPVSA